ncbi:hypothetical protein FDT66_04595 [Polaribacter aestuariivivens]|uniref:Uncharacterized protein n=1 Tax=Polaribacter aestuariivivens TaxID=2304626 RepID=A0A5S3N7H5_9FLAO|nr:hypothetical protein [Polaribacter aestuariivivens]TMM31253.1 hypothetical protein FDT66_04595 [Polaribacter aestuariivivens]
MSKQTICERERSYIEKMNKFQLSHKFKKVGYYFTFGVFGLMIIQKLFEEPSWIKPALRGLILFGMLLISVSKDKIEDEFIESLRSQSYRIAFILGILYALLQPFVNYAVGLLFDKNETMEGFSYFQVLFYMLIVQLMVFWQLKRMNK